MKFETELSDRLHAGVDDTAVDLDQLIAGSRTHGRRFTRRRRIGQVITAVAATAAVAGTIATVAAQNQPIAEPAAVVTPTPAIATKPITPQAALAILTGLLPADGRVSQSRGGNVGPIEKPDTIWVRARYTDSHGPTSVSLGLSWIEEPMDCSEGETCTAEELPNGSKLLLVAAPGPQKLRMNRVTLLRKDGWAVILLSDNAAKWKERGTRAEPALTLAQLKAIVLSPRWQKRIPAELVDESTRLFTPTSLPVKPTVPSSPEPSSPNPSGSPR